MKLPFRESFEQNEEKDALFETWIKATCWKPCYHFWPGWASKETFTSDCLKCTNATLFRLLQFNCFKTKHYLLASLACERCFSPHNQLPYVHTSNSRTTLKSWELGILTFPLNIKPIFENESPRILPTNRNNYICFLESKRVPGITDKQNSCKFIHRSSIMYCPTTTCPSQSNR